MPRRDRAYYEAVMRDNPLAYWPCNEASGALIDAVGNSDSDAGTGSITYGVQPGPLRNRGGVLEFAPDYPSRFHADSAALDSLDGADAFSQEFWFRTDTLTPASGIYQICFNSSSTAAWYSGMFLTAGKLYPFAAVNLAAIQRTVRPVDNTFMITSTVRWYHHVLTYSNPGALLLYLDGALAATSSPYSGAASFGTGGVYIGDYSVTGYTHDGGLGHVALYDYQLSAAQVRAHHDVGRFGPVPWRLNQINN